MWLCWMRKAAKCSVPPDYDGTWNLIHMLLRHLQALQDGSFYFSEKVEVARYSQETPLRICPK